MAQKRCIYCHFDQVTEDKCPKCGAPSSHNRQIRFNKVSGQGKSGHTLEPSDNQKANRPGSRRKSKVMRFVWFGLAGFFILGLFAHQNETTNLHQAPKQSQRSTNEKLSSKVFTLPKNDPDVIEYDSGIVPVLVGKNAKMVYSKLEDFGLYGEFVNSAGESMSDLLGKKVTGRGSWDDYLGPYYVCDQLPISGVPISDMADHITLTVSPKCRGHQPNYLAGNYAKKYNSWGPLIPLHPGTSEDSTFEGWISGSGMTGFLDTLEVKIRTPYEIKTVELEGLTYADNPCTSNTFIVKIWKAAAKQLKDELPVGTPVRIVDANGNGAVISKVKIQGLNGTVPKGTATVNEVLALGGYFVPTSAQLTGGQDSKSVAKWKLSFPEDATDLDKRLLKAANSAIENRTGPINLCPSK